MYHFNFSFFKKKERIILPNQKNDKYFSVKNNTCLENIHIYFSGLKSRYQYEYVE